MGARRRGVRLRPEHAEHAGILRVITLAMGWSASIALGLATGDMPIAIVLTLVVTAGHVVSWRTRMWRSARWQIVLLVPITIVAVLLVPSLPQAFQGDWLHPMRYLLLLQALASFYLHSRASLYTAQVLSGIVLLVSSQLAFDSLFLAFFFAFFGLQLVFFVAATGTDALRGAAGRGRWPGAFQRLGWSAFGVGALAAASLGAFLLLPWGSLSAPGASGSMLPLTGQALPGGGGGDEAGAIGDMLPLTGTGADEGGPQATEALPASGGSAGGATGEVLLVAPGGTQPETDGGLGTSLGDAGVPSPLFGGAGGRPGGLPGDGTSASGVPNPIVMQVRSPVATYWRGQTYSTFDGLQWLPDRTVPLEFSKRGGSSQYTQTFFLRQDQQVPLFGYSPLGWQPVGSHADGRLLDDGDVYRVVSERRNFHPAALQRAALGSVVNRGLDALVPPSVRDLASEITLGRSSSLSKSLAITQYLRSNYAYVASLLPWQPAQTIEQFLFGAHRAGTAFDFASAQTALAVASGLEARLVTGYLPGELDPLSGTYVVRASDAHAWTEVNFRGSAGWVPFDGNPREDGRATTTVRSGVAGAVAGLFDRRVGDEVRDGAKQALQQAASLGARLVRPVGVALLVVGAALFARWIARRRHGRWSGYTRLGGDERREVIRAYERLMRQVRGKVGERFAHETADQYFARLAQRFPHLWEELVWLKSRVNEAAYSPAGGAGGKLAGAQARFRALGRQIKAEVVP